MLIVFKILDKNGRNIVPMASFVHFIYHPPPSPVPN